MENKYTNWADNGPTLAYLKDGIATDAQLASIVANESKNTDCPTWDSGTTGHLPQFNPDLFLHLPALLRTGCETLVSTTEREVFLIGALGVVSGILPNVTGFYDGATVYPHLYVYLLAPYGTGKGSLKYAERLAMPIHRAMRSQSDESAMQYEQAVAQHAQDAASFKRNKSVTDVPPEKPVAPQNRMLFIPANNSKTGFFQLLHESDARAILFETEGDTLADSLKQDYGNFSDGLRKAFHHERISYYRRGNGGELVELESPALSVVISSTFDQLLNLLPTAENGLFSRFLYYNCEPDPSFRDVFDVQKKRYEPTFESLSADYQQVHKYLLRLEKPIQIELTLEQRTRFIHLFSDTKQYIYDDHTPSLGGSVNRLGLICFRLCMIFTVLRAFETGEPREVIVCGDTDFENAVCIVDVLFKHALSVYWRLPQSKQLASSQTASLPETEQKQRCIELRKQGMSIRQIATEVFGDIHKKSTVARWTS